MWTSEPLIFEDEDGEALKGEFVRVSAQYPAYDPFQVAAYVFRNQRDCEMRSQQAAMIWAKDLDVQERIRLLKLNGNGETAPLTKEALQAKILAVTENENIGYQQKKAMIEGYMAVAQTNGWVVKAVEKTIDNKRPHRQIVFKRYDE